MSVPLRIIEVSGFTGARDARGCGMNETSGGSDGTGLDGTGFGGSFATGSMPGFGGGQPLLAQTLGLAMARRAADILDRHRDMHDHAAPEHDSPEAAQFALDDAIFTAVL